MYVQTTPAVQGVEAIRSRVAELQLAGARVDLSEGSVDAQRSDINGEYNFPSLFLSIPLTYYSPDSHYHTQSHASRLCLCL